MWSTNSPDEDEIFGIVRKDSQKGYAKMSPLKQVQDQNIYRNTSASDTEHDVYIDPNPVDRVAQRLHKIRIFSDKNNPETRPRTKNVPSRSVQFWSPRHQTNPAYITKQQANEAMSQVSTSDDQVSESGLYVDILPEGETNLDLELNQDIPWGPDSEDPYLVADVGQYVKAKSYVGMNPIKQRKSSSVKQEHSSLYEEINLNMKVSFTLPRDTRSINQAETSNSFPHQRKLSHPAALPPPPLGRPNEFKRSPLDGDETYIQPNVFPQETNQSRRPPCRHPTFSYHPTEPEELYEEPTEYVPPTNPATKRHSGNFLMGAVHLSPASSRNSSTKSNKSTGDSRWMSPDCSHSCSQNSEDKNANKFQRKASPLMFNSPKLNNIDRYQNAQEVTNSPKPTSPKKPFFNSPIRKNNMEEQTYFKNMDRKQAEIMLKRLESPQIGNFIVRPGNTTQSGEHPYSVSIVSRVAMTIKVSHLKIRKRPEDGKYALGYIKENEQTYESAKNLIEHHFSYKLKLADNIGEVFLKPLS